MKRSPLPRSTKQIARNVRPKARRAKPRRVSVLRDRKYLNWLRDEGKCVACISVALSRGATEEAAKYYANMPCDPAHGPPAGMKVKGPDNDALPLCRPHHNEQTIMVGGWKAFEAKYGIDRAKEAATHYSAYLIMTGALPPADGLVKP